MSKFYFAPNRTCRVPLNTDKATIVLQHSPPVIGDLESRRAAAREAITNELLRRTLRINSESR